MRLSDTLGDPKELRVQFKRGILNVMYLPSRYTPAEIDRLQEDDTAAKGEKKAASARRIATMGAEIISSWDLTQDDGTPIPTDVDSLYNVPSDVLIAVIRAAQKDQSSGEDDAN